MDGVSKKATVTWVQTNNKWPQSAKICQSIYVIKTDKTN